MPGVLRSRLPAMLSLQAARPHKAMAATMIFMRFIVRMAVSYTHLAVDDRVPRPVVSDAARALARGIVDIEVVAVGIGGKSFPRGEW